jgi:hypothetical protein
VGSRNFSCRFADRKIPPILAAQLLQSAPHGVRFQLCINGRDPRGHNQKENIMSDSKKPAAKVTLHPVSAAIWRNQNQKGVFYSVTFERSYKDEAGKWQTSSSFDTNHLLLLAKVADLAHSKTIELRASERQPERAEDEAA